MAYAFTAEQEALWMVPRSGEESSDEDILDLPASATVMSCCALRGHCRPSSRSVGRARSHNTLHLNDVYVTNDGVFPCSLPGFPQTRNAKPVAHDPHGVRAPANPRGHDLIRLLAKESNLLPVPAGPVMPRM